MRLTLQTDLQKFLKLFVQLTLRINRHMFLFQRTVYVLPGFYTAADFINVVQECVEGLKKGKAAGLDGLIA